MPSPGAYRQCQHIRACRSDGSFKITACRRGVSLHSWYGCSFVRSSGVLKSTVVSLLRIWGRWKPNVHSCYPGLKKCGAHRASMWRHRGAFIPWRTASCLPGLQLFLKVLFFVSLHGWGWSYGVMELAGRRYLHPITTLKCLEMFLWYTSHWVNWAKHDHHK